MTAADYASRINSHYAPANLADAILQGLQKAGKDPQRLHYDDLGPVDQFHTRGKAATVELARRADLRAEMKVLDVGGGLGGPARTLAAEFGCRVTVLDLTEEYCRAGEMFTERTGLSGQVSFRCASALDMPFEDETFHAAWTQHSNMNIADKQRLYREIRRVLRPGGVLALHEVAAGPNRPIHFPVPWAAEAPLSFLRPVDELRTLIKRSGFEEMAFEDASGSALAWFRERVAASPATLPPVGLHLLLGPTLKPALQNMVRNLEEDRIAVVEAGYRKA